MERALRALTWAALLYEVHLGLVAWCDRRMDRELRWICETAPR